jgi:PAS domain S-box-containing protein
MKRVPSMKRRKRILAKTSVKGVQALMARELKQSSEELELQNLTLINSQNELELSRERYADLYDAAPVSFVTLTRSGLIVDINLPAVRVLGRNRYRLVGSPFLNFVVRSDQRTFLTHLSRCRRNLEQNKPLSVELELTRKSGEPQLFIELISTPSAGKRPESTTYKSIFIDITDRKHQEADLKRARDEAERANRAKDDFLATLSHELRTPLNPVLLVASDAARNKGLPSDVRGDFDMIRRNVELEARLIDDLLDLTRIARGKLVLERRLVHGQDILKEVISILRPEIEQKEITLRQELNGSKDWLLADAVRLHQIFWNLLSNAVKFTPARGTVVVETSVSKENEFVVVFSDTGIGMTPHEAAYIFDAFAQGEHAAAGASHRFGGLGIGLAISRKLVEFHSGSIEARSAGRDCGSTFTIKFPLARTDSNDPAAATRPAHDRSPKSAARTGLRILLVEDHEPTRIALEQLLLRRRYKVQAAGSMKEARAAAKKRKFDLLISDIGLPDGNGCDLLHELRQRSPIKGIALSGYGMDTDIAHSQDVGFAVHLTKPVRAQSLDEALSETAGS